MPKTATHSIHRDRKPNQRPTFHPNKIPDELKKLKRWVVWRSEPSDKPGGKPRKVPHTVDGRNAKSNDPKTWTTFEAALKAYKTGDYAGLMFAMVPEDGYVFVDLDGCRGAKNKTLNKLADKIVRQFDSYTEVSVSGTGVHILIKGTKPGKECRHGSVECYSQKQFMVVTGRTLKGKDQIHERQDQLESFYREYLEPSENDSNSKSLNPSEPIPEEKLKSLLANDKAASIYNGEYNGKYASQSEADLALCGIAVRRFRFTEAESRTLIETARKNAGADPKHDAYFETTYHKVSANISPVELADARNVFDKRLLYGDGPNHTLDIVLAVVASSHLPGDPVWLHLVGPPSSGKTEHISGVDGFPTVYSVSELTAAGLVSGIDTEDGKDHSLMPRLDNKTLCIKDFTTILDLPKESRQKLLGRLRDAYDGSQTIHTALVGTRTHRARFNLLTGVTGVIDKFWSNTSLGERFLLHRIPSVDPLLAGKRAIDGSVDKDQMRKELRDATHGVLASINQDCVPGVSEQVGDRITKLAAMLALARTHIDRGRNHQVTHVPEPEGPMRIAQQLKKLGQGLALINGRDEINEADLAILSQVALESMPSNRLRLIRELARLDGVSAARVQGIFGLSSKTAAREKLEDLRLLKIVVKRKTKGGDAYRFNAKFRGYIQGIEF